MDFLWWFADIGVEIWKPKGYCWQSGLAVFLYPFLFFSAFLLKLEAHSLSALWFWAIWQLKFGVLIFVFMSTLLFRVLLSIVVIDIMSFFYLLFFFFFSFSLIWRIHTLALVNYWNGISLAFFTVWEGPFCFFCWLLYTLFCRCLLVLLLYSCYTPIHSHFR